MTELERLELRVLTAAKDHLPSPDIILNAGLVKNDEEQLEKSDRGGLELSRIEPRLREHAKACKAVADYLQTSYRSAARTETRMRNLGELLRENNEDKCHRCWMTTFHCFCNVLGHVKRDMISPHSLSLYVHHNELLRSSNTGKLLYALAPESTYICGIQTHETALFNSLHPHNTLVLWPSPNAPTIPQFLSSVAQPIINNNNNNVDPFHVIILDSTWKRSSTLNQRIPRNIPRVAIRSASQGVFGSMRTFVRDGNVHTAAACYLAFLQLGLTASALKPLEDAIHACHEAYQAQAHKPLKRLPASSSRASSAS
eukprot:CAMPEP_0185845632 /NCGR_PEP_ID=MMETSP1354-20130828/1540_1 /TAXON_ID=708628 /ORGANISM="Erythrolobus madagascarensis, Strain CCMP3276" /LENGTH=312 /DNA_ID=CAMNT_0028545629 /DNA_START=24 /DNA_END=962 /DNA_ORIENTATION=-